MSDEEKNDGNTAAATAAAGAPSAQPSLDEHTTEPNIPDEPKTAPLPAAPGKWQMPKPKFQQTSGYLPQGYLKKMDQAPAGVDGFSGSEDTTQEQPPFVPPPPGPDGADGAGVPAVEPQPDLADQLVPEVPVADTSAASASGKSGSRIALIIFGLIGIFIFIVAFLAAVYFLFLAKPAGGNNF